MLREVLDVFSVCSSRTICLVYQQQSPAPHQTRLPPREVSVLRVPALPSPCLHGRQGKALPSAIKNTHNKIFTFVRLGAPDPPHATRGPYLRHWIYIPGSLFYLTTVVCPFPLLLRRACGRSAEFAIGKRADRK
jgi:hypothetical protein